MPILFQSLLLGHVLLGLSGVVLFVVVLLGLFQAVVKIRSSRVVSFFGFLSFLVSWILGGYYYVNYYGSSVKPGIKAGDYSWAHKVIMETKEHVFLFLPFLAFIIFLTFLLAGNNLNQDLGLKRVITFLTFLTIILGILIAVMGIFISGAA